MCRPLTNKYVPRYKNYFIANGLPQTTKMPSKVFLGKVLISDRKMNGSVHVKPAENNNHVTHKTTANGRGFSNSYQHHHRFENGPFRSIRRGILPSTGNGDLVTAENFHRIVINISGVRFETFKSTLQNVPDTRLAWLMTQPTNRMTNDCYDTAKGEYFFDRHAGVFEHVLNFYRTGKLHAPQDVCGPLFEEELSFWGIDDKQIEPCCWNNYRAHRDAEEQMAKFAYNNIDFAASSTEEDPYRRDNNNHDEDNEKKCNVADVTQQKQTWWQKFRPKVWKLLEHPTSSPAAQWYNMISMLIIGISIVTFCLLTLPSITPNTKVTGRVDPFACLFTGGRCRNAKCDNDLDDDEIESSTLSSVSQPRLLLNYSMIAQLGLQQATMTKISNTTSDTNVLVTNLTGPLESNASAVFVNVSVFHTDEQLLRHQDAKEQYQFAHHTVTVACSGVWVALNAIDGCCVVLFTLEFLARFVFCPKRRDFFRSSFTYYDILAFVPFYIQRVLMPLLPTQGSISSILLKVLNFSRIFRIFRVFKLARNVTGIKILMQTLRKSSNELLLLVSVLVLAMLIFSSCIYYAQLIELAFNDITLDEHARMLGDDGSTVITSVPIGLWWAAVTLTTIGYGDKRPTTNTGYFVGFFCAVSSALSLSLPVPIIVNNFAKYYQFVQAQMRLPPKRRRRHRVIMAHEVLAKHRQQYIPPIGDGSIGSSTSTTASAQSNRSTSTEIFNEQQVRRLNRRRRSLTRAESLSSNEATVIRNHNVNKPPANHVTSSAYDFLPRATSPKNVRFISNTNSATTEAEPFSTYDLLKRPNIPVNESKQARQVSMR